MSVYDFHMDEGKFLFFQLDSLKIMKNVLFMGECMGDSEMMKEKYCSGVCRF